MTTPLRSCSMGHAQDLLAHLPLDALKVWIMAVTLTVLVAGRSYDDYGQGQQPCLLWTNFHREHLSECINTKCHPEFRLLTLRMLKKRQALKIGLPHDPLGAQGPWSAPLVAKWDSSQLLPTSLKRWSQSDLSQSDLIPKTTRRSTPNRSS